MVIAPFQGGELNLPNVPGAASYPGGAASYPGGAPGFNYPTPPPPDPSADAGPLPDKISNNLQVSVFSTVMHHCLMLGILHSLQTIYKFVSCAHKS